MATSAASPTESQSAITLPGEKVGADASIPAESPAPIPSEAIPPERGDVPKKNALSRIKELYARNKQLQQHNDALRAENVALKESAVELRRQADEADGLRAQIVILEKRETEWQWLAIDGAEAEEARKKQAAEAEESRKKQAQQDNVKRFEVASNALIARSRPLASQSDWDEVMRKGSGFFSPALLEEVARCELGPEVAYWLASRPAACKELVHAPAGVVVRTLLQIEAEIKKQIATRRFLSLANGGR